MTQVCNHNLILYCQLSTSSTKLWAASLYTCSVDWGSTAERTNAFVTLVFGYSVVALLFQNKAAYGINAYVLHPISSQVAKKEQILW